ncbi:MBL fold metallo-hydrolase [Anaerotignum sp. MB30-C6]|uniref:MBL fold metallo-hydrolase n=1 Tax=Anaerotignum sp. MB30-C6 TaxID=3070814 RepID=UPI0027DC9C68|nr:MBL fold metallo-hydrolase [Anaerotignum sp. MB30-C6]WMI81909.1 MBL fold metallo-hydrolase [Anaerotignum sp. MB30-C6]
MMKFNIISSGSTGNATVLNDEILIDCGVSYKSLVGVMRGLKIALLTHIHGDHFNRTTISRLAKERPTLRFGCCEWLVRDLLDCGVDEKNIDVYQIGKWYDYTAFQVATVRLYHDVPNCGYRVQIQGRKAIYMTDTVSVEGIQAKDYDLYLVEANYIDEEIQEKIKEKEQLGEYSYERRVLQTHLSKEQCDEFLMENMNDKSEYVYMHQHKD